jgi:hypothetical protein
MLPLLIGIGHAQTPGTVRSVSPAERSVQRFLRRYVNVKVGYPGWDQAQRTEYTVGFIDLNGDGREEAMVYLGGPYWCGSGGCPMMILTPEKTTYRLVCTTLITRPPIRVIASKSYGWSDLTVWVAGGGIIPGYEARLRFNGSRYPLNPSIPPAQKIVDKVTGKTIISDSAQAQRLYPDQ